MNTIKRPPPPSFVHTSSPQLLAFIQLSWPAGEQRFCPDLLPGALRETERQGQFPTAGVSCVYRLTYSE